MNYRMRGLAIVIGSLLGTASGTAWGQELDAYTSIQVSITSPADATVFATGDTTTLEFTAQDVDRCRQSSSDPWCEFDDTLTFTWSGAGVFDPEVSVPDPAEGTSHTTSWTAPYEDGSVSICLAADDTGSTSKPNKDSGPATTQITLGVGRLNSLNGGYPNKEGGDIVVDEGDPEGALYIPQSVTATFFGNPTIEGFGQGWPHWSILKIPGTGWTSSRTDGNQSATVKANAGAISGYVICRYGMKEDGQHYHQSVINIYGVRIQKVTATTGNSHADSDYGDVSLKLGNGRDATLSVTFFPSNAPAYSTSSFKWKVTTKPEGSTPTLGANSFSSATDGDYAVTGYLDVSNDNVVDAAESSKAVKIAVATSLIRFADPKIDVFDRENYTKTFTVEVDDPTQRTATVDVSVVFNLEVQFTKLTGGDPYGQTKPVTLDGDGKGSVTFTITEDSMAGPGVDIIMAQTVGLADTREARACGITGTTVTYLRGVNNTGIDFWVSVATTGIGLEHYEKCQFWDADHASQFGGGKFEFPTGVAKLNSPYDDIKQGEADWPWGPAVEIVEDHQSWVTPGLRLQGVWRHGYLDTDRYFTIKYRNKDNSNSEVTDYRYNWNFAWHNHDLKVGDWWTEANGKGKITRKSNIANFPADW